jgi:hypothetical protein
MIPLRHSKQRAISNAQIRLGWKGFEERQKEMQVQTILNPFYYDFDK